MVSPATNDWHPARGAGRSWFACTQETGLWRQSLHRELERRELKRCGQSKVGDVFRTPSPDPLAESSFAVVHQGSFCFSSVTFRRSWRNLPFFHIFQKNTMGGLGRVVQLPQCHASPVSRIPQRSGCLIRDNDSDGSGETRCRSLGFRHSNPTGFGRQRAWSRVRL